MCSLPKLIDAKEKINDFQSTIQPSRPLHAFRNLNEAHFLYTTPTPISHISYMDTFTHRPHHSLDCLRNSFNSFSISASFGDRLWENTPTDPDGLLCSLYRPGGNAPSSYNTKRQRTMSTTLVHTYVSPKTILGDYSLQLFECLCI